MWRSLLIVVLAAVGGSVSGSLLIGIALGGRGATELARVVFAIAGVTMFFTLPGVLLLVGIQARLLARGWSAPATRIILVPVGSLIGASILGVFWGWRGVAAGGLYGLTSSLALFLFALALTKNTRMKPTVS